MNSLTLRNSFRLTLVCLAFGCYNLFAAEPAKERGEVDNSPVDSLDLERYLGRWYEIVRKPHFFEKGMTHVTATYSLRSDGKIEVLNQGLKNGKPKRTKATARTTEREGQLKVTFFIFPAEYNILEVAPDYSYAVVGGGSPKYLWILSRTPSQPQATLEGIYQRLAARGYDLTDLVFVEQ